MNLKKQTNRQSKKNKFTLHLTALFTLLVTGFYSQCTFTSSNGYQVEVKINVISLAATSTGGDCTLNATLQYDIKFTGSNRPASLWTLQGNVTCAGKRSFYDLPNEGGAGTVVAANAGGAPFISGNCSGYNKSMCNLITIIIQGPGIPYQEVPCTAVILPVEINSFDAVQEGKQIKFAFETASERDNDYFTLEGSEDGFSFSEVAQIKGSGTSAEAKKYTYSLTNPDLGRTYYRLAQTDFNGEKTYFNVILAVDYKLDQHFTFYPNPSKERNINVYMDAGSKSSSVLCKVYSIYGQLLSEDEINPETGASFKVNLPESGNQFIVTLEQDGNLIAREQVLVN